MPPASTTITADSPASTSTEPPSVTVESLMWASTSLAIEFTVIEPPSANELPLPAAPTAMATRSGDELAATRSAPVVSTMLPSMNAVIVFWIRLKLIAAPMAALLVGPRRPPPPRRSATCRSPAP